MVIKRMVINDLADDVICDIAIYADDTTDLWQQLEFAFELKSDVHKTLWIGVRSGLLISVLGKLAWFRLTGLITMVLLI